MSLSSETAIDEAPAGGFVCLVDGDGKYKYVHLHRLAICWSR